MWWTVCWLWQSMELCIHNHNHDITLLTSRVLSYCQLLSTLLIPNCWQPVIWFQSLCFPFLEISYEWNQIACSFWVWLLSLFKMCLRFTRVAAFNSLFFFLLNIIPCVNLSYLASPFMRLFPLQSCCALLKKFTFLCVFLNFHLS